MMELMELKNKSSDSDPGHIDPYYMLIKKLNRISWNGLSNPELSLDKSATILWFSKFKSYSDDTIKSVIIDGILDNQFHNISYILNLVQSDNFKHMSSMETYKLLYDFVCTIPKALEELIDESDLSMSQNVLALLSQSHNEKF